MLTVTGNAIHLAIPQQWNHLSGRQAELCARIIRQQMPKPEQQIRILIVLLNIKWYHFRQYWRLWTMGDHARYTLATQATEFLYGENTLTKNPFPILSPSLIHRALSTEHSLHGPAPLLENITAEEFAYCEMHYRDYLESGKLIHLQSLAAVLWRPSKSKAEIADRLYDGDPRIPFNPHTCEARAATLPANFPLYAILQFYEASRKVVLDELNTHFPDQSPSNNTITGWIKIFFSLAENIGNVDEVAKTRLSTIVSFLIHNKEDADEMKNRLKK